MNCARTRKRTQVLTHTDARNVVFLQLPFHLLEAAQHESELSGARI